jgi:hypothetical protein
MATAVREAAEALLPTLLIMHGLLPEAAAVQVVQAPEAILDLLPRMRAMPETMEEQEAAQAAAVAAEWIMLAAPAAMAAADFAETEAEVQMAVLSEPEALAALTEEMQQEFHYAQAEASVI